MVNVFLARWLRAQFGGFAEIPGRAAAVRLPAVFPPPSSSETGRVDSLGGRAAMDTFHGYA